MGRRTVCVALVLLSAALTTPTIAFARRDGIAADSCNGCHRGGQEPTVRLLASSSTPALGQMITLTVEIAAVNGPVGGFYLKTDGSGLLRAAAGSGIQMFDAISVGHSSPKQASAGVVRFTVDWTAPSQPGGVVFMVHAVSGNGDNSSQGDGVGEAQLSLAYGCSGELYTADPDGDGFGAIEYGQRRDCSTPQGFAARDGDCQEYEKEIHPDAAERCNHMDDDCDGKVDEGLPIGLQYPDHDGDGYGFGTDTVMDCNSPKGYAAEARDCDDAVATTHPKAEEVCNLIDDNCDGRTDENVRPACGVGWCRRLSPSCDPSFCKPGEPRAEECNAFDDDCDDRADEDATCPAGKRCSGGTCLPLMAAGGGESGAAGSVAVADAGPAGPGGSVAQASAAGGCSGSGQAANELCRIPAQAANQATSRAGGCSVAHVGGQTDGAWWLALVLGSVWLMLERFKNLTQHVGNSSDAVRGAHAREVAARDLHPTDRA
ncbi:MAG: hypothetical protein RL701_7313 [Pseudomonadota bacterium]